MVGLSDAKGAALFGIKPRPDHGAELAASLVVISDSHQRIVGIYKGAGVQDVETLLGRLSL